jgi:uncharacterized phage protein gp47/JayE
MSDSASTILARMLATISDTYDKTDGSFFYDILEPVATELAAIDAYKDTILTYGFASTSTGDYLDKIVDEVGLSRKDGTYATGYVTITGTSGSAITEGCYVSSDNYKFAFTGTSVVPTSGSIDVEVKCTTEGTAGNVVSGAIKYFPVTLSGLTSVTNNDAFTSGYEEETDDTLRERYYTKVQTIASSGNSADYIVWAESVSGVGDAKVVESWNGNGTVKVIIIDSNKIGASDTLVETTAEYIETYRPVCVDVTVVSATEVSIALSLTLTLEDGYDTDTITSSITSTITSYLATLAFDKDYVSYAKIGSYIIDIDGVEDYDDLLVNGGTDNISISSDEVAVMGAVTVG